MQRLTLKILQFRFERSLCTGFCLCSLTDTVKVCYESGANFSGEKNFFRQKFDGPAYLSMFVVRSAGRVIWRP